MQYMSYLCPMSGANVHYTTTMTAGESTGRVRRNRAQGGRSDLLRRVGRVVLQTRHDAGLSRRALSERCGVSSRFLAQLEAGTGNISLLRLERVATALDVPLLQILSTPSSEGARRIALLGLRGAGKSTVGKGLARRLRLPFIELDALIEAAAGLSLGQIFELHGERYFRRLERETLARFLSAGQAAVLATGGGLVADPDTYALLRSTCTTVWLSARAEDHYSRVLAQGDRRPMADHPHAMAELQALLVSRQGLYEMADMRVDTSAMGARAAVAAIVAELRPPRRGPGGTARP